MGVATYFMAKGSIRSADDAGSSTSHSAVPKEGVAAEIVGFLHRRSPDFARRVLKVIATPATPMVHRNAGWVSNQVR
jgi:hypothetical protein